MNIKNIKRVLDDANIWYSCPTENDDINILEVTAVPTIQSEMYRKLFVLTDSSLRKAQKNGTDLSMFANVVLDCNSVPKYLRKLTPLNLILIGSGDIDKAISALNEAMR